MARPTIELTDDHIRQIEELAGLGLTMKKIASVIGICERTFRNRKKDDERVVAALHRDMATAEATISRALFEKAKSGDVPAIRWWEMTRVGRSETTRNVLAGDQDNPLEMKPTKELALLPVKPMDKLSDSVS